jgi:hypothetical protein
LPRLRTASNTMAVMRGSGRCVFIGLPP